MIIVDHVAVRSHITPYNTPCHCGALPLVIGLPMSGDQVTLQWTPRTKRFVLVLGTVSVITRPIIKRRTHHDKLIKQKSIQNFRLKVYPYVLHVGKPFDIYSKWQMVCSKDLLHIFHNAPVTYSTCNKLLVFHVFFHSSNSFLSWIKILCNPFTIDMVWTHLSLDKMAMASISQTIFSDAF